MASDSRTASPSQLRLQRALGRAIADYDLIANGDRIMVAVSGGKDSYTLLHLLRDLQRRAPVEFSLKVVNVDQGHPGYPRELLQAYMDREGYDFTMLSEDTYSIVKANIPEGKTYCSLCSRLRRGILYRAAREFGCNKIALGHHRDDALQTLMLNMFFAGKLGAMPPKLVADQGRQVVIRPLSYCAESDIRVFAEEQAFPILPCDLCGSQENLQRKVIANMLDELERKHPGVKHSMLGALGNVLPTHLFDRKLAQQLGIDTPQETDRGEESAPAPIAAEALTRLRVTS
jgi:tRNA 2-thiocytidine biosynthesis protein TtcA